jgi:hypothetical protein
MRAACCLTTAAFNRHCKPLAELGIKTFTEAETLGLIKPMEARFMRAQLGDNIPSQEQFNTYQNNAFDKIRDLAFG